MSVNLSVNEALNQEVVNGGLPLLEEIQNSSLGGVNQFQIANNTSRTNNSVSFYSNGEKSFLHLANVPGGSVSAAISDAVNSVNKNKSQDFIIYADGAKLTQKDIEKLLTVHRGGTVTINRGDLSGLDLRRLSRPFSAEGIEFADSNFRNTNMSGIDLRRDGVRITGQAFFQGANLSNAKFDGNDLLQAVARTADDRTNMAGAKFIVEIPFHNLGPGNDLLNFAASQFAQPTRDVQSALNILKTHTPSIVVEYNRVPSFPQY
jgi:uncharacterized protein YjbI with pentapeptide repeats